VAMIISYHFTCFVTIIRIYPSGNVRNA